MTVKKFPNKSYRPKQLLHWCAEEEGFEEVIIFGVYKDGGMRYHTSKEDFSFYSAVYFSVQQLINRMFKFTEFKR